MGHTFYSSVDRATRTSSLGYDTKPASEIFTQRSINNAMDPCGLEIRESRDSKEHPNSIAIILGLDVTGSMGSVPHYLVRNGLPRMMDGIMNRGVQDPQVLFLGIGDHDCGDEAPLQVGQFESGDELLDKWLTDLYIEGGGGGNDGESYLLAWYLAANHTSIDCFEKRGRKGFLFTVGDEKTLGDIGSTRINGIMGTSQADTNSAADLFNRAQEQYDVYHIHVRGQTSNGRRQDVVDHWQQLIGENLLVVERKEDVVMAITNVVAMSIMEPAKNVQAEGQEAIIDAEPML